MSYPEELAGLRAGSGLKNTFLRASNTYKDLSVTFIKVTFWMEFT